MMSFRSTNLPSQPDVPFPTGTSRLFGAPCRIMPSAINRMGTAIPVAIFGVMTLRYLIESSSNCGSYLCTPNTEPLAFRLLRDWLVSRRDRHRAGSPPWACSDCRSESIVRCISSALFRNASAAR